MTPNNESIRPSHVSFDMLRLALHKQILNALTKSSPQSRAHAGVVAEKILNILNANLNVFFLIHGKMIKGSFPTKSRKMLGQEAHDLILQSDFSTIKEAGEIDLNHLTAEDWHFLQLALRSLAEEK